MPETMIVSGKHCPKGSVLKVTVTLLLRSISDAETDAMTATGADVNSFVGSGRSLHKNGVTELWRERNG
jgi:hypothetical protein